MAVSHRAAATAAETVAVKYVIMSIKNTQGGITMSLFGFGKKKEENCCDNAENKKKMNDSDTGNHHNGQVTENNSENKINNIKVLGSGCKNCHTLFVNTNEALKTMGISCEAEYITDMTVVASYGIMSTPALVVNDKVVAMGKVYQPSEIEKLLHKLGY